MITQEGDRLLIEGPVTIGTVSALLEQSRALLVPGVAVLDFKGVTEVDSAAVGWRACARRAGANSRCRLRTFPRRAAARAKLPASTTSLKIRRLIRRSMCGFL